MGSEEIEHWTPTVQIIPRLIGYDVVVITDRHGTGGYGWRTSALTYRGAERAASRLMRESLRTQAIRAVEELGQQGIFYKPGGQP